MTSFVTEYRCRSPHHAAPFTIEAEYSTKEEIDEQLHELLYSYRSLFQEGLEKDLEGENGADEYRAIERRSVVALSTLQSIFPHRDEVTLENLQDNSQGAFDRIYKQLQELAEQLVWPPGAENGRWVRTATSADDCHDQVSLFTAGGLWPLTNIVR